MPEKFDEFAIRLHPADDVAVIKRTVKAGTELQNGSVRVTTAKTIPAGHKLALLPIRDGAAVRRYGQIIGFAKGDIAAGEHVHTHNLVARDFNRDYTAGTTVKTLEPAREARTFAGYLRPGGKVGTRNYVAIISTVNCSASVSRYIKERFREEDLRRDFPNVDGVIALTHKVGCGIPAAESLKLLERVTVGMAHHSNISGYVMIGLGCEMNQVGVLRKNYDLEKLKPGECAPAFMTIQGTGGVRKSVDAGVAAVAKLLPIVNEAQRSAQPISKLTLAENCGGSDGNSGITANPALGVASDLLVSHGGTSVLAETPEIYGAEHLLIHRAVNQAVADKLIRQIHWWENYAKLFNASIDNNPSYGNKEGGLTTIFEKSLGAVAKGGQAPLAAVYDYAEEITTPGFCFMDTPGYDPVSMTGLIAGGCNIGVFTTGRGSVYGCKPAPCIKVATNSTLYNWMEEDMDLNAGTILDGTETVEQVGQRIFEKIISVASGEKTKSELAGIGDEEFAPWFIGPQF
ncbi:MAG TPA: altronate dehydratase family protein [Candidatus Limnocylindria bacterium]|nr:altronate dehydratase family protein [Candidatus Limnocylindria bacterium]